MHKIKQKLNSKRGVSIVMALLLALICLFAGAAALTAASANIGRYTYLRDDQQEYLSISSAARLLSEQFKQGSHITATCTDAGATIDPTKLPDGQNVYKLLQQWLNDLLFNAYFKAHPNPAATPHTLSDKTFTVEATGFDPVTVTVKAKDPESSSADIEVELSTGNRKLKFNVTLTFKTDDTAKTITVESAKVERITLPGK